MVCDGTYVSVALIPKIVVSPTAIITTSISKRKSLKTNFFEWADGKNIDKGNKSLYKNEHAGKYKKLNKLLDTSNITEEVVHDLAKKWS